MKFVSSRNKSRLFSLKETVYAGLAPDGGLFMPLKYPSLSLRNYKNRELNSFSDLAFRLAKPYLDEDLDDDTIDKIVKEAFDFEIPLRKIKEGIYALELFHGPTLAFKDVGARFMARLIAELNRDDMEITILVATSGDTGGAVASGFHRIPNIKVVVLYPEGKVSRFQEKQFTTLGNNIECLSVDGTFDDCQRLVKEAFTDIKFRVDKIDGDEDKEDNFYVLRETKMRAVLVEFLFFDNYSDWQLLQNEEIIEKYAKSLYKSLLKIEAL